MDGSEVTVVVMGRKEVGKTTFVAHCLDFFKSEVKRETCSTVHVCGRDVRVRMLMNPESPTTAHVAIVLIDLTIEDALRSLPDALEDCRRINPAATPAVVATKADLYHNRKIATEDAVRFCAEWGQGVGPIPYYETGLDPPDSIMFAFQEILARPLIDGYLQEVSTKPKLQSTFICEAMDWCLENGSANLLTHLRSLGHLVPSLLFDKYPEILSEYFFGERPPILVPEFTKNDLSIAPEPASFEDTLDETDEPLEVVDSRPAISVSRSYLLPWTSLSLSVFLPNFLRSQSLSVSTLSHVDLSHNHLSEITVEVFRLPALKSLDVSHNHITALPAVEHWARGSRLQLLNASHNSLIGGESPLHQRRGDGDVSVPYAGELWCVDLSHNDFCGFPSWLLRFRNLKILNLTRNPQIRRLPAQLSQLSHLTSLSVDTRSLHDPPPSIAGRGPAELLRYLQLKRQSSQAWNTLRVVVVGPKGAGKSQLVAKIRDDKTGPSVPTKGLEVSEWKHRGSDFFSFKSKLVTVDFWDFSGDPDYHIIYSCFKCSSSLHLVVCNAQLFEQPALLKWLAGIQATSSERIPVIIVFTHLDKFPSREQKDGFRREVIQWLHSWEATVQKGNHAPSAVPQGVKNLSGEDITSSFESQPASGATLLDNHETPGEYSPLFPFVHRVFFVNPVTGDGTGALRKCLVKIATGSLSQELAVFSGFQMIGRDIPSTYIHIEAIVRHLRDKFRSSRREGEQRPFYTISELVYKKLKRPLSEYKIEERDFTAALYFLHENGLVYLHKCREPSTTLVSVDPQLVGFLLQRMIRACLINPEVNSTSCCLPNSHIFMLWGVEPVWALELEQASDTVYSQHLLDYLYGLNLCTPLLPGLTLLPSILPAHLPSSDNPSPSPSLHSRRVYFFSYFPPHLFPQLISRVVGGFLKISGGPPSPISPGQAPLFTPGVPFEMQSGLMLYVWKNNLFLKHGARAQLLVKLLAVSPSAIPHEARLDILLDAVPETEAKWLRVVTMEIDYLLEHVYPGLITTAFSEQLVEAYVTCPLETEGEMSPDYRESEAGGRGVGGAGKGRGEEGRGGRGEVGEASEQEDVERDGIMVKEEQIDFDIFHEVADERGSLDERESGGGGETGDRGGEGGGGGEEDDVFVEEAGPPPSKKCGDERAHCQMKGGNAGGINIGSPGLGRSGGGREGERRWGEMPVVGSFHSWASSPGSSRQRVVIEQDMSSWEVLSKQSSTSTRFSIKTDYSSSHFLVPVWECLRASFKSPVIRVNNRSMCLNELVPDLLFGDISSDLILRSPDHLGSGQQNRLETAAKLPNHHGLGQWNGLGTGTRLCSGMKTGLKRNGLGTRDGHSTGLQSLPEQTGMRTENQCQNTTDGAQQNGIRTQDLTQSGTQPSTGTSGLHIRSYYTSEDEEECGRVETGSAKMLCLKKCLQNAQEDLNKLRQLQCPYVVSAVGVHFSPPSVAVESAPYGSLHHHIRKEGRDGGLVEAGTIHNILLQLLSTLEYFHDEGLNYHTLSSENVLLWSLEPISIKLSDSGIAHTPHGCELCSYIKATPPKYRRKSIGTRIDYMLLGLLVYELSTGMKAYEHVYSLATVVLGLLHKKLSINVEAELNCSRKRGRQKANQRTVSCHRMCMQTTVEECTGRERVSPDLLRARLSLCGGNHEWSPVRLTLNPECLLCSEEGDLVYWTSGSRGLVTGTLDTSTGTLNSNILQEPPTPESGLYAHRRGKPVPIAVGRTTALSLVEETQQLWVGAENGSMGSVYVFKLPDMRRHHYIHLQDAVLSLTALNKVSVRHGGEEMKYRVLVGLANGTIIQFLGIHQGKIFENPLLGPKLIIHLAGNKPCITMQLTAQGLVWSSSGNGVEVLDTVTLKSIQKLPLSLPQSENQPLQRNDPITLLNINWYGLWTVGRRSPILRLWNQESGKLTASYNIHDVLGKSEDDITAMALQGRGVWLGTRNGYLFFLDAAAVQEEREVCHLGLQHCGEGRVKNIVPLVNKKQVSAKLEVVCSLEYPDEVSGTVMMWSYQYQQDWRPRPTGTSAPPLPSLTPSPLPT